ncbi:MAG: LamG domain-containing protein [Limisphaerales bacterium]
MKNYTSIKSFCRITALLSIFLFTASLHAALVGYWNFDNNTLAETSGYQPAGTHDGIAVGTIGYTTGVKGTGGALDMRFNQGAVKVKNTDENANPEGNYQNTFNEHLYSSLAGFTIAFWAKDLPGGSWQPWISRNGDGSWGYQIRRTDQNFATFTIRSSDGPDDPTPTGSSTDFSDGRWHHIAAVYDPVNGQRVVYVDGVAEINIPDGNLSNNSGEYLVFGAQNPNAWVTNVFANFSHVALDEIRIYDNALTQGDVQALVGNPWIYVDSSTATMTNGGGDITVSVTVPTSLVATSAVEVVVTSPNTGIADLVGGTAGVLKLEFPQGGGNVQNYTLHATGQGIVTIQHTSTNTWVDGSKQIIVWPSSQPADGLVAYWNFDSDSLAESAGYAPTGLHDGTPVGTIAYVAGPTGHGRALAITNANSAVRINNSGQTDRDAAQTFGNDLYSSPDGFSIAFWAKNLPAADWTAWISKYGEGSYGYQVRKIGGGPSATFTLRSSIGTDDPGTTTTDFTDGRWHHITAVYDPVNFQRRLYIDGIAQINVTDGLLDPATVPGEHLLLGGEETNGNNVDQGINYGNNVYLDEVRIYKKALGDADVLNLVASIAASPTSLALVSPSANDHFVTISIPPSLVATSAVNVVVSSDNPSAAIPEGAVGGNLTVTFPMGGANTASFAVQANGPGTVHLSYSSALLPSAATTTVTVQQPNISGLVAYWNFDSQSLVETSGFQSAGTHDGQTVGNVAYVPGLKGGYALDLRQPNTAVRIKNTMLSDANYRNTFDGFLFGSSSGFSFTCWIKGLPQNNWCAWIAKDGETTGYQLRRAGDASSIAFTVRNSDGDDDATSPGAVITDNLWHHLAAVYDPASSQRRIYIDGVEQLNVFDANLTTPPVNSPLFFGARDLPGGNPFFAGVVMDEVRVYDKALSVDEIITQAGPPMIVLGPSALNLNVGDPDTSMISIAVPSSLVATSSVSVTLTTANASVAKPVGATGNSLVVNFPMGGNNTASVAVHAVGTGNTSFTAISPQATVNGDIAVSVSAAPQLIGHWFSGAASLADTSGFRPAGIHDGMAIGNSPGNLAYSSDVPAGFSGQSLNLSAGNVAVAINNTASSDAGYLPTYDSVMATNFTIAFWAKGLPGGWSAWVSKDGDDNVGYQIRRYGGDNHAAFTIRGTPGSDDVEGNVDLSDTSVWHQYAAVWNGTLGTRQLYIDGVLDTGINLTGDSSPFSMANNYHLVIGGQQSSSGYPANAFSGLVYDVRIYNNALSGAGIQNLQTPSSSVTPPTIIVKAWTGNQVRISWPVSVTGFSLQQSSTLSSDWTNSGLSAAIEGSENAAYVSTTNNVKFYRLVK